MHDIINLIQERLGRVKFRWVSVYFVEIEYCGCVFSIREQLKEIENPPSLCVYEVCKHDRDETLEKTKPAEALERLLCKRTQSAA